MNSQSYKYHFTVSHRLPGVVSFCFDDHVHNNHLICSDCHTQSRLTLLLQIQQNGDINFGIAFFIYSLLMYYAAVMAKFNLWQLQYVISKNCVCENSYLILDC